MPETFSFTAGGADSGRRLDVFLTESLEGLSRARVQKLIDQGLVLVNGAIKPSRTKLEIGDIITGEIADLQAPVSRPQSIPLDVVYQDEHLVVINKQRGLTVHPGSGRPDGTLVNALAAMFGELPQGEEPDRPGIVHRLDKDTSGLMIVARTAQAMTILQRMVAERQIERRYLALVWGSPRFNRAVVDAAIGRDPKHPERMAVLPEEGPARSRSSVTNLEVTERFDVASLLEAQLETGRTHQIRVHCAYAGYPVVGDPLYCRQRTLPEPYTAAEGREFDKLMLDLAGQALHACSLRLAHPVHQSPLDFRAAPPPEMLRVIEFFRSHTSSSGSLT